ncbi:MAG: folate-binding protein [Pseudomonadota bacterium]
MTDTQSSRRTIIELKGAETLPFLQGLITQDPSGDAPYFACLLTPQGKILFDFFVIPTEEGALIDVASEVAAALEKRLKLYRLRAKIDISIRPDLFVHVAEEGANAPKGALYWFEDPRLTVLGMRGIVESDGSGAVDRPASVEWQEYDARRFAHGVPEFNADFEGDDVFLLDVNYDVLGGVSYKKGCFVGQEVTSRMKRKGEVRKRTVIVRSEGASLREGAEINSGETSLGKIISASGKTGLAIVRLDRWAKTKESGDQASIEGVAASLDLPTYLATE